MSTVDVIEEQAWTMPSLGNNTQTFNNLTNDEMIWLLVFSSSILALIYTFLKSKT